VADRKAVWIVRWTYVEYGGSSHGTQPSYHLTREDAEAFKEQREGPLWQRTQQFFEDGYQYVGSQPIEEFVSQGEYEQIKGLGKGGFLGPTR
jgi:hypothetical protein